MNRRRMMMLQNASKENWDFNWNYKQGLLSNYLTTTFSGEATETMTEKGLFLEVNAAELSSTNYVRYEFTPSNSNKAVIEMLININKFAKQDGFRILLSQGNKGCQLYIQEGYIGYEAGLNSVGTPVFISKIPLALNTDYLIRIEYSITFGNRITVNNALLYEGSIFSSAYCTHNRLYQQKDGSTYIKEVRFKHIA